MLAGRVTVQTGAIVIGMCLPAGQVTVFATAARLVEYAKTLLRTITATLTPGVAALEARGDVEGIRSLFLSATRWVLYLVLPVNLSLWFFGRPFLIRWVPEVGVAGYLPLAVLTTTLTLGVAQSVASRVLYGLGRLKLFARLALADAGLNLILSLAFVRPFGVVGVALAVAGPNLLFCLAVIASTLRPLGIPLRNYLLTWVKPALAAVVPLMLWSLSGSVSATWGGLAVGIATGLVPYTLVAVVFEMRMPRVRSGRPVTLKS
jgi:O-antigen/teichoic acid export membrane protein